MITPNLYTRGGEYVLADGTPYTGTYYTTCDNEAYTGANPLKGANKRLFKLPPPAPSSQASVKTSQPIPNKQNTAQSTISDGVLTALKFYFPQPTKAEYAQGYFTRYFAKNVTGPQYIIEISPSDWNLVKSGQASQTILDYETIDLLWQISGPLHDQRVSQYQVNGGIYDTNKRITEGKARGFNGLLDFINGEYAKFGTITS